MSEFICRPVGVADFPSQARTLMRHGPRQRSKIGGTGLERERAGGKLANATRQAVGACTKSI